MNANATTAPATDTAAAKPKRTAPAEGMKRCPGVLALGRMAHEVPATTEYFSVNKSLPQGLATRCRVDDGLYGKAWSAAKKAGETFSAKLGADVPPSVRAALAPKATAAAAQAAPAQAARPSLTADGKVVPLRRAQAAPAAPAAPVAPATRYADPLAERADKRQAKGYTTELVGTVIYALPEDVDVMGTPEGQAALEAVNTARANLRRQRNTDAKRASRAAAKEAASKA